MRIDIDVIVSPLDIKCVVLRSDHSVAMCEW